MTLLVAPTLLSWEARAKMDVFGSNGKASRQQSFFHRFPDDNCFNRFVTWFSSANLSAVLLIKL